MPDGLAVHALNGCRRLALLVEAPGKRARVAALARRVWRHVEEVEVFATKGHVAAFADSFSDDDVDVVRGVMPGRRLTDSGRSVLRSVIAFRPDAVVLACDDDDEGHVIALDCVTWLAPHLGDSVFWRMKLRSLDDAGFAVAARAIVPYGDAHRAEAASGYARAGLDRWLAVTCSPMRGIGVGRVVSTVLNILATRSRDFLWRVVRSAPDGFAAVATVRVDGPVRIDGVVPPPPPLDVGVGVSSPPSNPVLSVGQVMHRLVTERVGGVSDVAAAADSLQRLYESGRLTYCRPQGMWLPDDALRDLAVASGMGRAPDRPSWLPSQGEGHPALAPIKPSAGLAGVDVFNLDSDTAVLARVSRWQAEQVWSVVGRAVEADDSAWRAWCDEVGLRVVARPVWTLRRPVLPWQARFVRPGVEPVREDAATYVFRRMVENNLGRPSTWVEHVRKVVGHGLVDRQGALTRRGWIWLQAAPRWLREPNAAQALEDACRRPMPNDGDGEACCRVRLCRAVSVARSLADDHALRESGAALPKVPSGRVHAAVREPIPVESAVRSAVIREMPVVPAGDEPSASLPMRAAMP